LEVGNIVAQEHGRDGGRRDDPDEALDPVAGVPSPREYLVVGCHEPHELWNVALARCVSARRASSGSATSWPTSFSNCEMRLITTEVTAFISRAAPEKLPSRATRRNAADVEIVFIQCRPSNCNRRGIVPNHAPVGD